MKFKKLVKGLTFLTSCLFLLTACSSNKSSINKEKLPSNYQVALKEAKGTTVTYYGFGGTETQNRWVDEVVTPMMKKKGIELKRVPMPIEDIMNKLNNEKQSNVKKGRMDVVWINGENFNNAKKLKLLAGPITNNLIPNMGKYINQSDPDVKKDMGITTNQLEIPYGNAQLVMIGSKKMFNNQMPTSAIALLNWAKKNPGKLTYVAPPDFTGSAFVRNIIYETVGYKSLEEAPVNKKAIYKVIKPSLDYLNQLKPYLWQQGKTYPKSAAQMDKMFSDHQIAMTFNYNQMYAPTMQQSGDFSDDAQTFIFDKGTIGNYNYLAIPKTSPNKAAAVVLINTMLSKTAQEKRLDLKYGAVVSPYSNDKMPASMTNKMKQVEKKNNVSLSTINKKRMPEVSSSKIPIIEDLWKEYVLNAD